MLVAGIRGLYMRPTVQQLFGAGVQLGIAFSEQYVQVVQAGALACLGQHAFRLLQLLAFPRQLDLAEGKFTIAMHSVSDLRQVTVTLGRYDRVFAGGEFYADRVQLAGLDRQAKRRQFRQQALIERGHAIIIETRRLSAVYRHLFRLPAP